MAFVQSASWRVASPTGLGDAVGTARRAAGYLPQEVTFPRGMTAFAFVDYLAVLKERDDRRPRHREVDRVLDVVGPGDRRTRPIRTLSGGQRRRRGFS